MELYKYKGTMGKKDKKQKATGAMKKLRTDGKQRHRKGSHSRQPDDGLNFRWIKLQVKRHLPILTFISVHINFYDCDQSFPYLNTETVS